MIKIPRIIALFVLTFFVSQCYAINVNVSSPSSKLDGLGFTVNGSKHGGMGNKYHAGQMPKGTYSFGVRVHGKDIPCYEGSNKTVKLTKNTNALLVLKGRRCTVKIN